LTSSSSSSLYASQPGDKCEQLKKKLASAKSEDKEATLASNKAQERFYKQELPDTIKRVRELNQLIVIFLESLIKDYYGMVVQTVPSTQQCMADISSWVAKSDYRVSMAQLAKLEADEAFNQPKPLALIEDLVWRTLHSFFLFFFYSLIPSFLVSSGIGQCLTAGLLPPVDGRVCNVD